MSTSDLKTPADSILRLERARELARTGQVLQAELICVAVLKDTPRNAGAAQMIAEFALQRGDAARAVQLLEPLVRDDATPPQAARNLAVAHLAGGQPARARDVLEAALAHAPASPPTWLLLAQVCDRLGHPGAALKACYQAVTRAQRAGQWTNEANTPPLLLDAVLNAIERVRRGRRELFSSAYDALRQEHGAQALARVDRALAGYLRDWDATPADERQRPKFFFFPDLPNTPYHDPFLQPWAERLRAAFPQIRADALRVLEEDRQLPNFVRDPAQVANHVSGDGPAPAWEAFFFYRRGERYDANHRRCPDTSAALESIELCRIADQAPEILFSVLKPGSHINAHHGVTNVRLVMHLPLIVPPDCALNLVDRGEHHWEEGRLVMFDDTYLHEAWNRSDRTRVVLLMDCWNPHLTGVEKQAVKLLIETISGLHEADQATRRAGGKAAVADSQR